jgi:hypothetical protein
MTKLTYITNQQLQGRKQANAPKVPTWQTFFSHRPTINITLLVILVGVGLSYLHLVNQTAAKTFQLSELTHQVNTISKQNQALQLDMSEALSLQRISATKKDHLVPATTVEYLTTTASVALSNK